MKKYEYVEEFKIRHTEVDFKDEIKTSSILALMQEGASASAEELGFGYSFIAPKGYAFMLTNAYIQFTKPITLGEIFRLKTWPSVPTYAVFGREYVFETPQEEIVAKGTSRWCLVDIKTGKILSSKYIDNQNYETYNTEKVFDSVKWKLPLFEKEEGRCGFIIKIANSEYDHNLHVNNTRYADYCLNCFTVAELKERKMKSFQISYVRQCKENDVLSYYRKDMGNNVFLIQGYNEDNLLVTQAEVCFEER